ncbi:MAG: CoA transferase [Dehalococcoidia bacterium]|nr:MAG: CoA transferase [Dehalococcoidia bacterium]
MSETARPMRDVAHRLPLEGIRVAEITVVWAGPHVTQLLGEWGADVIRVEPVNAIQPYSRYPERILDETAARALAATGYTLAAYPDFQAGTDPWNRSPSFNSHARNKRSMACNVRTPAGREAFLRLIQHVDVLVENNVPQTIERSGITYDVLREINPRLIMLRMPAYGLDGPYKNYRGFGTHVEGMIGHHLIRTYEDGSPEEMGDTYTADALAGVMGAFAVTSALRSRERTGLGQQIEMPLAEAFLPVLGEYILDYTMNGRDSVQEGNGHHSHAPHGIYAAAGEDQWVALDIVTDAEFEAFCRATEAEALLKDERFASAATRRTHRKALDAAVSAVTQRFDKDALFHTLQEAGVCAAPVHDDLDCTRSPHLAARGFFEDLTIEGVGTHRYPGIMTKWGNTPNWIRKPPPRVGEHSEEIYVDLLGYSRAEYEALVAQGEVGTTYPPDVLARGVG